MKKRLILLCFTLAVLMLFSACVGGEGKETEFETEPPGTEAGTEKIPETPGEAPIAADDLPEYMYRVYREISRLREAVKDYLSTEGLDYDKTAAEYDGLSWQDQSLMPKELYVLRKNNVGKDAFLAYINAEHANDQQVIEAAEMLFSEDHGAMRDYFTVNYSLRCVQEDGTAILCTLPDLVWKNGSYSWMVDYTKMRAAGYGSKEINTFLDKCEALLQRGRSDIKEADLYEMREMYAESTVKQAYLMLDYWGGPQGEEYAVSPFCYAINQDFNEELENTFPEYSAYVAERASGESSADTLWEWFSFKGATLPDFVYFICDTSFSKEEFVKRYQSLRGENTVSPVAGYRYLTDEEIDILFSDDDQKIFETFVSPLALQYEGRAYTLSFLSYVRSAYGDGWLARLEIPKQEILIWLDRLSELTGISYEGAKAAYTEIDIP